MSTALHALIIEDSKDDTFLLLRQLQQGGFEVVWEQVETAEALCTALAQRHWDVILSDYSLPGFNAPAAFQILKQTGLDIPFIVVSGTIGEAAAVAMMKAGAHDYFVKGNLTRICEAIRREVQEVQIHVAQAQADRALANAQERLQLAIDGASLGLWDWLVQARSLTCNDLGAQIIGYTLKELEPFTLKVWRRYAHPEDWHQAFSAMKRHFRKETPVYECELRLRHQSGAWVWVLVRGKVMEWDGMSNPVRMAGTFLDISERKHTEATLQESNRRWRMLLENVQLAVVERDLSGNIVYANPFFLQLTGYRAEEVLQQNWFELFPAPSQRQAAAEHFQQGLAQNTYTLYQASLLTKTGQERLMAWNNTILRSADGQPIGKVSIGEDITERTKVERMKAEFISMVSHELRTPLTSMQAALSLLSDKIIDPTSEEGEATIQIATEGTDRLVRLVNDILDLERLGSGKVHLTKQLCNIDNLVETAIAQMHELATQAEMTLKASPCAYQVEADRDRLLQVFTNLLSNAIKFSPQRSVIQVSVTLKQADQPTYLLFAVCDQGRGIPADNLESIFDRFRQVDASDAREKGGTGLGLAICRNIVQQHGGEIWAESTMGKGSTFYFTLPIMKEEKRKP